MTSNQIYDTDEFLNAIPRLSDTLFLFIFIGAWLLAVGIIILLFNLLGISTPAIVNNIPLAFFVGIMGGLLWLSLIFFSVSLIERFRKKLESQNAKKSD